MENKAETPPFSSKHSNKHNILSKILNTEWESKPIRENEPCFTLNEYIESLLQFKDNITDTNDLIYLISAKVTLSHLYELEKTIINYTAEISKWDNIFDSRSIQLMCHNINSIVLRHLGDIEELSQYFKDCWPILDNYPSSHLRKYVQSNIKKLKTSNLLKIILSRYLIKIQIEIETYTDIYNEAKLDIKSNKNLFNSSSSSIENPSISIE